MKLKVYNVHKIKIKSMKVIILKCCGRPAVETSGVWPRPAVERPIAQACSSSSGDAAS